jgi:hypothetical protein
VEPGPQISAARYRFAEFADIQAALDQSSQIAYPKGSTALDSGHRVRLSVAEGIAASTKKSSEATIPDSSICLCFLAKTLGFYGFTY